MGVPQGALDEPGRHARFEQMGGGGMPQGGEGDAHVRDPGPLCGGTKGARNTGATHGRGRRRTLVVIPPRGRQEPGRVTRGFPGGA